jgi:hypothetical protein
MPAGHDRKSAGLPVSRIALFDATNASGKATTNPSIATPNRL